MVLNICPKATGLAFLAAVFTVNLVSVAVLVDHFLFDTYGPLSEFFDVGVEANVPTFFSAVIILCSAAIAWFQGTRSRVVDDGQHRYWFGLCAVLAFLAVDEATAIHEWFTNLFGLFIERDGYLYYPWVLPYSVLALVFGLVYARFLIALPRATARRLIVAAIVYLSGALVFEMLSARVAQLEGTESLTYTVLYSIEEFLEMSGIVLLIYALLAHGLEEGKCWEIRISSQ